MSGHTGGFLCLLGQLVPLPPPLVCSKSSQVKSKVIAGGFRACHSKVGEVEDTVEEKLIQSGSDGDVVSIFIGKKPGG